MEFQNLRSILFIRSDRIGDIIISTAFLNKLKEINPDAEISILLGKYNRHASFLVRDLIDDVIELPKNFKSFLKTIFEIRNRHFDLIIDPIDNPSTTSTLLVGLGRAKNSLGFNKTNKVYTHVVNSPDRSKVHIAKRLIHLLKPFNIDPDTISEKPSIALNEKLQDYLKRKYKVENNAIGIVLSGSNDTKFWGIDNFEKLLIDLIKKTDHQVLIYQTPQHPIDYWNLVESRQTVFIPPGRDLEEFVAMISLSSVLFTPDTAAVHIASAFDIPCVAMYRVKDVNRYGIPWYPIGVDSIVLTDDIAINRISPSTVYDSIMKLINRNSQN